jgi:alpha-glucosidase
MVIEHPFDNNVYDWQYLHQFTVGADLMICPTPSYERFTRVYFPAGGSWYSLHDGASFAGGSSVIVDSPIEKLPIFVREGGILFAQSLVQSTKELPSDTLRVHIWPGSTTRTATWYDDDGKSYDYEKGTSVSRSIVHNAAKRTLSVSAARGAFQSGFKYLRVIIHGGVQPASASINGTPARVQDDVFAFLGGIQKFDPLGGASDNTALPVKTLTAPFSSGEITFTY